MIKVLIIGLGNIGCRHLESLANVNMNLLIDCVDSSEIVINKIQKKIDSKNIRFFSNLEDIDKKYEFLIHSTSSDVRLKLLTQILNVSKIKYCILEKLLVQSLEDLLILKKLCTQIEKCWVNTPMHEWDLYKKLTEHVNILDVSNVQFNNFEGLACNAIHFIDFISSWKKMLPSKIETSKLTNWYESKRKGFYDLYGELKIIYPDKTSLILKSLKDINDYHCLIKEKNRLWKLVEKDKIFYSDDGVKITGEVEFQSQLTKKIVHNILSSNKCNLPELNWSIDCHRLLIKSLLNYWNSYYNSNVNVVPIT